MYVDEEEEKDEAIRREESRTLARAGFGNVGEERDRDAASGDVLWPVDIRRRYCRRRGPSKTRDKMVWATHVSTRER